MKYGSLIIGKLKLPPPGILHDRQALDIWYKGLSSIDRGRFDVYLNQLIAHQPVQVQLQIQNKIAQQQATGLGFITTLIGAGITAATSAGVSLYNGHEQRDLQKALAGQQANIQLQSTAISAMAEKEIQKQMAEAQMKAAEVAAAAQKQATSDMARATVEKAKIEAQRDILVGQTSSPAAVLTEYKTPVMVGGAALLGLAAYMMLKK